MVQNYTITPLRLSSNDNNSTIAELRSGHRMYSFTESLYVRQFHMTADMSQPMSKFVAAVTSYYGDSELFISNQMININTTEPWMTQWTWRSYDAGTSSVEVFANDPLLSCMTLTMCDFYIAVFPHNESSYYHLLATNGSDPVVRLRHGQALNFAGTSLFEYRPEVWEANMDVRISITPTYGAAYIVHQSLLRRRSASLADHY